MNETAKKIIKNVLGIALIIVSGCVWLWLGSVGLVLARYNYELNNTLGAHFGLIVCAVIFWFIYRTGRRMLGNGTVLKIFLIVFWLVVIGIVGINLFIPDIWLK
ncbi:MAG: hypothetical protein A2166_06755 [Omnitrophica WOR_2 bacterium RBG_13_41_10]|nr:MAG: hypothetical protein A2166_06755 [Omnitrophica WOR_2 bacterium RBG_13_41_10]